MAFVLLHCGRAGNAIGRRGCGSPSLPHENAATPPPSSGAAFVRLGGWGLGAGAGGRRAGRANQHLKISRFLRPVRNPNEKTLVVSYLKWSAVRLPPVERRTAWPRSPARKPG